MAMMQPAIANNREFSFSKTLGSPGRLRDRAMRSK
jgi:hypothetical protein